MFWLSRHSFLVYNSNMAINTTIFGKLAGGQEVKKITIREENGTQVSILTFGAIIQEFLVPCRGELRNIVFSSPSLEDYISDGSYKGQIVAPYANRIANARFSLDEHEYVLEKNNGENNLHSGSANLGQRIWNVIFQTENSVVLNCEHRDGDGGFPGNIGVTVAYLLENGRLTISYTMSSDRKCAVNPTNHSYFNLKGDGASILDHKVMIAADKVVMVDDTLIPTDAVPVAGTDFDFTSFHEVGERRGGRYDHCFVFNAAQKAEVVCDGLSLTVDTDRPAMQLYTGEFNPSCNCLWPSSGPFCALALETSEYPDAVNRKDFPSAVLDAGQVFKTRTSYTVREVE